MKLLFLLLVSSFCLGIRCWDTEELEIFDLVEEINRNFYEFMDIAQDATNNEIKRAFRNLSIVLHPDKNPAEDANIQFRNLVSIYEVLKDPSKREKYNKVLKEGLPNWKSALYYYRRMRKIGLYEGALIIFIIITIGQYLFAWAAYVEKKYTAEQVFGSKLKKLQKKNKNIDIETILNEIPVPSLLHTLPCQIPLAIWNLPKSIKNAFNKANELKELALEKRRLEVEEARLREELEKELEEQACLRKLKKENLRKRKENTKAPEKTDDDLRGYAQIKARVITDDDAVRPAAQKTTTLSGGFWTDEDLVELIRLVKKYPSGSANRWNTIADTMNRTVQEVTFMAAKMKENGYRIPGQSDSVAENIVDQSRAALKKEKIKKSTDEKSILITETNWTQEQQLALETAIVKHRSNTVDDRWQKIASCVPGKTKEECLVRFKYLCELIKAQKNVQNEEALSKPVEDRGQEETAVTSVKKVELKLPAEEEQILETPVTEETVEVADQSGKKRSKRKERRKRKNSADDSDDAYTYEMS